MTRLTLILPCYNEAERLPATLKRFLDHLPPEPDEVEVLVVDDGSTDGTVEVAEAVARGDRRVRVIPSWPNRGKGYVVRTGMLAARGDVVVFTDADGSYGPAEVDRVVRALASAPVAIGARPLDGGSAPLARRIASRTFNLAMRAMLGLPFHDTQCGLKGFRRDTARALFSRARVNGFAFDAEVLLLARHLGIRVVEVPVRAEERDGSKVRLIVDALHMLREVWLIRRTAARGGYQRPSLPA